MKENKAKIFIEIISFLKKVLGISPRTVFLKMVNHKGLEPLAR